jgi:hypothetical protein
MQSKEYKIMRRLKSTEIEIDSCKDYCVALKRMDKLIDEYAQDLWSKNGLIDEIEAILKAQDTFFIESQSHV